MAPRSALSVSAEGNSVAPNRSSRFGSAIRNLPSAIPMARALPSASVWSSSSTGILVPLVSNKNTLSRVQAISTSRTSLEPVSPRSPTNFCCSPLGARRARASCVRTAGSSSAGAAQTARLLHQMANIILKICFMCSSKMGAEVLASALAVAPLPACFR